ncbi:MAG: hypothetical protein GW903_08265 [Alphaproteobacteria bacterium]|nr:hypothetical protein [Alphaproteobacteria bacterium]NCQ88794.1 hypothetical protein [Alphaproteobacteria bacterium]NCT07283.1 hypothetical protein [Alphaproteobacteria bacterium]
MSEAKNFNANDILNSQRAFMEGWLSMMGGAPSQAKNSEEQKDGNWHSFMAQIRQASQTYFEMAQRFTSLSNDNLSIDQIAQDWINQMTALFSGMINQPAPRAEDMMKNPNSFSFLFPFTGNAFNKIYRSGDFSVVQGFFEEQIEQYLAMPSLGYNRKSQDEYKKFIALMMSYQKTTNDYNKAMGKVGLEALAAFQLKLVQEMNKEEKNLSLKDIYDLWTMAAEEVYGAYVVTEAYTVLYGQMINSMMALKQQASLMMDGVLESMNIPTRTEVDTLSKKVHAIKTTCDRLIPDEFEKMQQQIEALQKQMGVKRAVIKAAPAAKPGVKKSTKKIVKASAKTAVKKAAPKNQPASSKQSRNTKKKGK